MFGLALDRECPTAGAPKACRAVATHHLGGTHVARVPPLSLHLRRDGSFILFFRKTRAAPAVTHGGRSANSLPAIDFQERPSSPW